MQRLAPYLFLLAGLAACRVGTTSDPLPVPAQYDGSAFAANTAAVAPLVQQYARLVAEARRGRTFGVTVPAATLVDVFTNGPVSLRNATSPYYIGRLEGTTGYFAELAKASGGGFSPTNRRGDGGVYNGYLFDENGLALEPAIEQGLLAAALYNRATQLASTDDVTPATADQVLYLFGATPASRNSTDATRWTTTADQRMAAYAAQRDRADGTGPYTRIRDAFIRYQAALQSGERYANDRAEAWADIKLNWEKGSAATVMYLLHSAATLLAAPRPTEVQKAQALYALGEAAGLLHGWRLLPVSQKRITDPQVDELLALLNVPREGPATTYLFVTESAAQLPKLTQAVGRLQLLYDFTAADVENFRKNWVQEQKR